MVGETPRGSIPFGENMTEKHCRLLGHIGQIAMLAELGRKQHEEDRPLPGTNSVTKAIRETCLALYEGDFDGIAKRFGVYNFDTVHEHTLAERLGMLQQNKLRNRQELTGIAQAAFRFHAGKAEFFIPRQFEDPFQNVVRFYAQRTFEEVALHVSTDQDDGFVVTDSLTRSGDGIIYDVKYLEPVLDDSFACGIEGR